MKVAGVVCETTPERSATEAPSHALFEGEGAGEKGYLFNVNAITKEESERFMMEVGYVRQEDGRRSPERSWEAMRVYA